MSAGLDSGDGTFFGSRGPDPDPIEPTVGCESRGPVQSPNSPGGGGCDARIQDPIP